MKTKYLLLGVGLMLAAGGLWAGRMVWRAHHQLVTLNVRNLPLAEVLRKIERQTWTKIRAEKALDARITLHVSDKPLTNVLDRIAEQAGARWATIHGVYASAHGLEKLDSALRGDGKLEPVGWTKIAPTPPAPDPAEGDEHGPMLRLRPNPGAGGPPGGQLRQITVRRGPNGAMVVQNGNGDTETWSPETLVMETGLTNRLGGESPTPTAAGAEKVARKLNAKSATILAFEKSKLGMAFAGSASVQLGSGPMNRSDPMKRSPNERFARLTPEQRVLRARERLELNQKQP